MTFQDFLAVCTVGLTGCAAAPGTAPVPPQLDPPAGQRWLMTLAATGTQIYECRRAATGQTGWAFVAPQADLFDATGRRVGDHGAGPHWTASDGSRVLGSVAARADAPMAGAIPWLLLNARNDGGPGRLAGVASIQRVATVGGLAPAEPCNDARLGLRREIPYRADYRFFGA